MIDRYGLEVGRSARPPAKSLVKETKSGRIENEARFIDGVVYDRSGLTAATTTTAKTN
jgi:hypothetical protein